MEDVIRVSIGSEPSQWLATQVLKSSIRRRTRRVVEFTYSWTPEQDWHPLFKKSPRLRRGTNFSGWRWMVPAVYGNEGRAIYLDADIVLLADIGLLWDALPLTGPMLAAVTDADPDGLWGRKTLKECRKPYKNKVQTSVMTMNCRLCEWDWHPLFKQVEMGRLEYADLMQANWIPRDRIHSLDPGWNHFSIRKPGTKLVHWSMVKYQPWTYPRPKEQATQIWLQELSLSIDAGDITDNDVNKEIEKGFTHEFFAR